MKCIILFVVVIATATQAVITDEQKQFLLTTRAKCEQESGVSVDQVTKIRQGQFNEEPKVKDYLVCFMKQYRVVNDSGDFQPDEIEKKFSTLVGAENVDNIKRDCLKKKATIQDTCFEYAKCSFKYRPREVYGN